jgi:glycosyltransferase involved in cell wall biosynthesis
MKPEVTIGVCVKNSEEFIGEAISSILDQDFPHERMEVIFVDDGSKDNTLSIIQDHVTRMNLPARVFHTSWKGVGHARNVVAANAQGAFILWVDGDMVLSKDFVRKLVEFMEQHPKVGIAKGKQALEPGKNLLSTLEAYSRAAGRMVNYQSEKGRSKVLGTGGSIYRSEIIRQVGGFDENLRGYNEDWDIEIRARRAGWLLSAADAVFLDYERHGLTWKGLWSRYWLRGYFTHYFLHKNRGMIKHYRMFPPSAFLSGLLNSSTLFKLTRQKAVFLLAFQSTFKMTAWYAGFVRSHLKSYAPRS